MFLEIGWTCDDSIRGFSDEFGDQRRISESSCSNRHIVVLRDQIDLAVGEVQVDGDIRIFGEELCDKFRQEVSPHGYRRSDAQFSLGLLLEFKQGALGAVEMRQSLLRMFCEKSSGISQGHGPCGSIQEFGTKTRFEFSNFPAHVGFWNSENFCGPPEISGLGNAQENFCGVEVVLSHRWDTIIQNA